MVMFYVKDKVSKAKDGYEVAGLLKDKIGNEEGFFEFGMLKVEPYSKCPGYEGEHGWRSGENPRLPPMCPGFCSAPRDFFPGTPVFPSPQKPTFDLI